MKNSLLTNGQHHQHGIVQKKRQAPLPAHESSKLGQELHDGVNPLLSAALLYLHMINPITKRDKKIKETVLTILLEASGYIRNLAANLVFLDEREKDFRALVERYAERINKIGLFSINIDFEKTGQPLQLTDDEVLNLYRIIQEQINNIIKYSKAKKVNITFKANAEGIYLKIEDDGIGFDIGDKSDGIGLYNMKKRMEELHGILTIESSPGNGCIVYICLPPRLV